MKLHFTLYLLSMVSTIVVIYFYAHTYHKIKLHLHKLKRKESIRELIKHKDFKDKKLKEEVLYLERIGYFIIIPGFLYVMSIILRMQ